MGQLFLSIEGALHFAFLIQAYEAAPESIMNRILRMHVEDVDVWRARRAPRIDFSGLSPLEIRAECAGIRKAVERLTQGNEQATLRARHGLTEYIDEGDRRVFFYDDDRQQAVKTLSQWANEYHYPDVNLLALDMIVARHYARKDTRVTLRFIAERFGKSHTYYRKIANELGKSLDSFEMRALDTLTPYFLEEHHGYSVA